MIFARNKSALVIKVLFVLLTAMTIFPSSAYANAGLPMIAIMFPGMLVALVPVILIEAAILAKLLKLTFPKSLKVSGIGNLVSTVIGIPMAWGLMVLPMMIFGYALSFSGIRNEIANKVLSVTLFSAWLGPWTDSWMIPSAAIFLLIPFFFASWWIEYDVGKRLLDIEPRVIRTAVMKTNITSYILLAICILIIWITELPLL